MARNRKRNYKPKYASKRLDMRDGGRVKLAHGGEPPRPVRADYSTNAGFLAAFRRWQSRWNQWNDNHGDDSQEDNGGNEQNDENNGDEQEEDRGDDGTPITGMTEAEKLRQFNKERSERNIRAGRTAEGIATGDVEAFVPDIKVDTLTDESGNVPESTIADSVQMAQTGMSPQEIADSQRQRVDTMSATQAAKPDDVSAATFDASQIKKPAVVNAASGELSPEAVASVEEIRNLSGPAEAARVSKALVDSAKADTVEGVLSAGAFSPNVTGIGGQLASTPQAEKEQREAIVGDAAMGSAAEILTTVNYEAAQQRAVKGTAAKLSLIHI